MGPPLFNHGELTRLSRKRFSGIPIRLPYLLIYFLLLSFIKGSKKLSRAKEFTAFKVHKSSNVYIYILFGFIFRYYV